MNFENGTRQVTTDTKLNKMFVNYIGKNIILIFIHHIPV